MNERPAGIDANQIGMEYIEWLEGQNERLRKMEDVLNRIENSKLNNRDNFLRMFKDLKVA